jgi:hypothetical protein
MNSLVEEDKLKNNFKLKGELINPQKLNYFIDNDKLNYLFSISVK